MSWWRSHPDISIRATAAELMLAGGIDSAMLLLHEGIPGANDGYAHKPLGELDSGPVRNLLASAAYVVLRHSSPAEAYDRLIAFF